MRVQHEHHRFAGGGRVKPGGTALDRGKVADKVDDNDEDKGKEEEEGDKADALQRIVCETRHSSS